MRIVILESVDSTQDEVARRLKAGDLVEAVLACEQTAGRGRLGKEWQTLPGESLAVSFAWHSAVDSMWLPGLALAAGLVAAETFDTQIAWPNDLVIRGRKVGGVLSEIVSCPAGKVLVIGLGLNISKAPHEMDWATSLALEKREAPPPIAAAEAFLARIERSAIPERFSDIAERWRLRDATPGKSYTLPDGRVGITQGVDADGSLRVRVGAETVVVPSAQAIYGSGS